MTGKGQSILLMGRRDGETISLEEYRSGGGYEALQKVLREGNSDGVIGELKESGLRGMGGAGFPTARKWGLLKKDAPRPRYVIANTDEMEPGTFKDRVLISVNPHALIEGMLIAAYTASARKGLIFIRPSYEEETLLIEKAMEDAREAGYLGSGVLGSDFSFEAVAHRSAGRYICGETKGMIHAIEGKRPHPNIETHLTSSGLWGQPTVVNNAETLANVPNIVLKGAQWFKRLGRHDKAPGTKIYTVSGMVRRPGAFELPFGTPLREIIEEHAEGMPAGCEYKACLPGGGSTRYLPEKHFDVPMDFESVSAIGPLYRFGTGCIVVFDQKTCLVAATLNLLEFFSRESCGWCTPCREGLPYVKHILGRIEQGEGNERDLDLLGQMCGHMSKAYCAFAPGAVAPVQGLLEDFADEVQEHILQKKCPFQQARRDRLERFFRQNADVDSGQG